MIKTHINRWPRVLSAFLIVACIFGELFPFLNIDLGFETIKPIHSALVLVSLYCVGVWIGRLIDKSAFGIIKKDWKSWSIFAFFAIWFVAGALWLLLTDTNAYALTEVAAVFVNLLFAFCLLTLIRNIEDVFFSLRVCVFSGVVLSILSCVEAVIGSFVPYSRYFYTLEQKIEMEQTFFSPTTVFHNQNDFAAFLLMCFAIVCFWTIRAKTIKDFSGCIAIALILSIPAILSGSTIFYITACFLVVFTCVILFVNKRASAKIRLSRIAAILAVLGFVVFVGSGVVQNVSEHLNKSFYTVKIQQYYDYLSGQSPDQPLVPGGIPDALDPNNPDVPNAPGHDTLSGQLGAYQKGYGTIHTRLWLIRAGWSFFLENPLLGNGPESYRDMLTESEYYLKKTDGIVNPHCFYIELLSQYGIIFFLMLMALVLYLVCLSLRQTIAELSNGTPGKGLISLFLIGTFAVAAIMPSSAIRFTVLWLFLLFGFCLQKQEDGLEANRSAEE